MENQVKDRWQIFREQALERLGRIYGFPKSTTLTEEIIALAKAADLQNSAVCRLWDQQDLILICYGDSVLDDGEKPLSSLHSFLKQRLAGVATTVHILPFFPYSSDDGFSVIDYTQVNPELGDWDDVAAIGQEIDLMVDLVINHCSRQHVWFEEFLQQKLPGCDYFLCIDPREDLSQVVRPRQSPLLTPVETAAGTRYVWSTFSADQIDVNFSNPQVLLEFIKILLLYLQQGARFVRLDAVAFLWKEIGTSCLNLPQTHEVVKLLRNLLELVSPQTVLLTETNLPHHQNLSYFGDSDEAHMIYQFSLAPLLLHALFRGTSQYLTEWARTRCVAPPGCTFLNFTASHDGIGVRPVEGLLPQGELDILLQGMQQFGGLISSKSNADGSISPYEINIGYFDALKGTWLGEDSWQISRFLCAQSLMIGLRGIPAIYIHSLLATPNDLDGVEQTGRARSINRRRLKRRELEAQLADPQTAPAMVYGELKKRIALRREQPAFHPDARQEILHLGQPLFGFWRHSLTGEQALLAVHNLTDQRQQLYLDGALDGQLEGRWIDLLAGEQEINTRTGRVELDPYQVRWLVQG